MAEIIHSDEERLSRKLGKLLEQNKGESLFSILFTRSSIKDEFIPLAKLDNNRLEYHVDKALNS